VIEQDTRPKITLTHNEMQLHVRADTSQEFRQSIIDEWLRNELKRAIPPLIEKWQPIMGIVVKKFFVQKMKSRWGSCNYTMGKRAL
jgi:predicted metal-dependent hydrolase